MNFPVFKKNVPTSASDRDSLIQNKTWGQVFTDHMFVMQYRSDKGWHDGKIVEHKAIDLSPAAMSLHYGLQVFEGLKAYKQPDSGAVFFRPQLNALRLNNSAHRLAMMGLPDGVFTNSVVALAKQERDWIPNSKNAALYFRPFIICTDGALGLRQGNEFLYVVLATPVNSYFSGDENAVTVWVSEKFTRAAFGGTGAAKCGGNYAASLIAMTEGRKNGCDQVLFLDSKERRWIEEFGAMNAFFVFSDKSILTPGLNGNILPGVTRDSLIALARSMGLSVREAPYSIEQLEADARSGHIREAFACGTAAVVTGVGRIKGANYDFVIGDGSVGPVTQLLKKSLTDIQYGLVSDSFGWTHKIY